MAEMDDSGVVVPEQNPNTAPMASAVGPEENPVVIQASEDELKDWWARIDDSRAIRKNLEKNWELLMKAYMPIVTDGSQDVKAAIHFRNVHTKSSKMFFKAPDLILTAEGPLKDPQPDPLTGMVFTAADAVPVKQAYLNKKLGRKGVNVKKLIQEQLFDVLAWSGLSPAKIGYRNITKPVQEPVMIPDPNFIPPLPDPSMPPDPMAPPPAPPMVQATDPVTAEPQFQTTQVTIWEEWYWSRFSPKKLLLPAELRSTNYDKEAGWIGMEFFMPERVARSTFKIPANVQLPKATSNDDRVYEHSESKAQKPKDMVHGIEIWYRASIFSDDEVNPEAIRQLVLFEGNKATAFVHRPSPDQTFDEMGVLTPDSMQGFPIHIMTNRVLADSPFPPADSAFTNSEVKHINTHRQQSVKLRDANIGKYLFDVDAFTPEEIGRLQNGEVGEFIAVQAGRLAQGSDKILVPVIKNEPARDDYRLAVTLKQDVDETLGISGPQAGVSGDGGKTATEIATVDNRATERLEGESEFVTDYYLTGVEKFDALVQRYADDMDYVQVTGQDGLRHLQAWNRKMISAKWAYEIKPDSQRRVDAARDRAQKLEFLKVAGAFPFFNPKPIIKSLANDYGIDPNEVILPDMPGMVPGMPGAPPPPGGGSVPGSKPTGTNGALPNAPAPGKGTTEMVHNKERG